jgi:enoyl-CoA hydratase/carnithine racemase
METANMCTVEKRGRVHLITLTGAGEHRLGPALISALRSAVATVHASPGAGALVLAAEGKYFSNGFDQAWARTVPHHLHASMRGAFRGLVADLIALPMPTVAAVTGHAAAAGCVLALAHDAVVMRASRGFLYMSEVDAGLKMADFFGEVLRQKVPDAAARRDMVLRGDKMTALWPQPSRRPRDSRRGGGTGRSWPRSERRCGPPCGERSRTTAPMRRRRGRGCSTIALH